MKTLQVGDRMPYFSEIDQHGKRWTPDDFKGKKLIVFFYPRANTPGCTAQVCNLRDHYQQLQDQGYELLGVSADTSKKQSNFSTKHQLPFPLLADTERKIIEAFGVWGPKKFMGRVFDGIHRKTFVIDADGIITRVIDQVKTKDHAAQLI
jgi:peroxiredoxin Q/BCP